ncbi:uncharacterized protein LOC141775358 isoform X2 [Sebastes fasciatus]|uniref:uncharacterized protein LOC141775358 isoform X2 n=1 Tax=Sebastes fasciatus TaxID=394691 RepID=UPI003D9E5369
MGDTNYQTWFLMFLALQNRFWSFMDDRPELTQEMNMHDLHTGLTYQPQAVDLDLHQLTDLEEQSVVLEENLRRTEIEILRSRNSRLQLLRLRNVRNLQTDLKKLQAELRAAIKTLVGMSTRKYTGGTFSSRRSMLELEELVKERGPLRFQSCPNIPSEDLLDFDSLKKWSSLNRTISFKRSFEDILKTFDIEIDSLDMRLKNKLQKLFYPGYQGQANSSLPSPQAAGQGLRSESPSSKSDSLRARETTCKATSHISEQSRRHHLHALHNTGHSEHRIAESESPTQRHRSQNNNPEVSPSQTMPRAAPQPIGTVHRPTIQAPPSQGLLRETVQQRQNRIIDLSRNLRSTNAESESPTQRHRSQSNNPEVSPSQTMPRAAPQPIGTVHRPTIQAPPSQGLLGEAVQQRWNRIIDRLRSLLSTISQTGGKQPVRADVWSAVQLPSMRAGCQSLTNSDQAVKLGSADQI